MAKKKAKPKKEVPAESFEQALGELDAIVADLEGGELGLAESLDRYAEGVERLKKCHSQLEEAERRIELLSGLDADGNPVTTPFAAEGASSDSPSAASRSRKRSSGSSAGGVDDSTRLF